MRSALFVLVCAAVALVFGCGRPPLRVSSEAQTIVVDMQKLGEYPSDVERLRLTDATSNRVVWEVRGHNQPQLGRVQLHIGENAAAIADVRHGMYEVLTPSETSTFRLEARKPYVIEVWGRNDVPRTKQQAEFIAPDG